MRRKADLGIGMRAYIAVHQLFPGKSTAKIAKIIGCQKQTIAFWQQGETPSGIFLQQLCYLGADIDWILTGRSKKS